MNILVFSDRDEIRSYFAAVERSKSYTVSYRPARDLKKTTSKTGNALLYVDVASYQPPERSKTLKYLAGLTAHWYAVIDTGDQIEDVGSLFFNNAADYVGRHQFEEGLSAKRLQAIIKYRDIDLSCIDRSADDSFSCIPSGPEWSDIKPGHEYTFCFLFFELDQMNDYKEKTGASHVTNLANRFREHVQRVIIPLKGRMWMPLEFGGLVLFPFDGKGCPPILTCFRLVMNRHMFINEDLALDTFLSFRFVLHVGNTVYESEGHTGSIISDSINSIFHLGTKFAREGNFYLTADAARFIPPWLGKYFLPAGSFEGRNIVRMRLNN